MATSTFRRSRAGNCGPWSDLTEFRTQSSSYVCPHYLQVFKESDQEQLRKSGNTVFFFHYKFMGIFFRRSRVANSTVGGRILPIFELLRALLHIVITCKYEKDGMKNSEGKVATSILGRSRAGNSVARGQI